MRNLDFTTNFEGRLTENARVLEKNETTTFFFTVAIDDGYKDGKSGEWIPRTKFVECALRCRNISEKRREYLTNKLLCKGYKVKGVGQFSEPHVDIDKKTGRPYKDKNGKYKASIILNVEDIKLTAKPNGNPVPTDKAQPMIQNEQAADDLPF